MIWSLDTDDFRPECSNVRYPLLRAINYEFSKLGPVQIDIKREGGPEDPVEGSNVSLNCYIRGYKFSRPPMWFHHNSSGYYHPLTFPNKSFEWITEPTIQISEQPNKGLTKH
jgi:hypothetical protein